MNNPVLFGWLLLLLTTVLNVIVANAVLRSGRMWFGLVQLVAVPMFVGFALAQMGVRLMGGGQ